MASEKNKHGGRLTIAVCTASVCYVLYMLHDTLNSPLIPQARPPFLLLTLSQKTKVHFVLLAAMFLFYTSTQHSVGDASRSARSHWLLQLNISSLFISHDSIWSHKYQTCLEHDYVCTPLTLQDYLDRWCVQHSIVPRSIQLHVNAPYPQCTL